MPQEKKRLGWTDAKEKGTGEGSLEGRARSTARGKKAGKKNRMEAAHNQRRLHWQPITTLVTIIAEKGKLGRGWFQRHQWRDKSWGGANTQN